MDLIDKQALRGYETFVKANYIDADSIKIESTHVIRVSGKVRKAHDIEFTPFEHFYENTVGAGFDPADVPRIVKFLEGVYQPKKCDSDNIKAILADGRQFLAELYKRGFVPSHFSNNGAINARLKNSDSSYKFAKRVDNSFMQYGWFKHMNGLIDIIEKYLDDNAERRKLIIITVLEATVDRTDEFTRKFYYEGNHLISRHPIWGDRVVLAYMRPREIAFAKDVIREAGYEFMKDSNCISIGPRGPPTFTLLKGIVLVFYEKVIDERCATHAVRSELRDMFDNLLYHYKNGTPEYKTYIKNDPLMLGGDGSDGRGDSQARDDLQHMLHWIERDLDGFR